MCEGSHGYEPAIPNRPNGPTQQDRMDPMDRHSKFEGTDWTEWKNWTDTVKQDPDERFTRRYSCSTRKKKKFVSKGPIYCSCDIMVYSFVILDI